ncbi:type IV secretory system conjugative DNA transfer family protein, partial [Acinetobacter radioresistens]
PEQTENLIAIDDTEFSHDEIENLVAVDEPDPLAMIAEMENLVAVDEPEQMENLVSADESDPLTMIAELENLEDSLFVLGVTKFSHDEAKQIVDTVFNCAESEFAVDEDQQDNLNAVNKGQNGSIENSEIDDVYQAFSDQVNSK